MRLGGWGHARMLLKMFAFKRAVCRRTSRHLAWLKRKQDMSHCQQISHPAQTAAPCDRHVWCSGGVNAKGCAGSSFTNLMAAATSWRQVKPEGTYAIPQQGNFASTFYSLLGRRHRAASSVQWHASSSNDEAAVGGYTFQTASMQHHSASFCHVRSAVLQIRNGRLWQYQL